MLVTAAPGLDESRVRRIELPRVYPKPGSRGSRTKRERNSLMGSSVRMGRCVMSTDCPFGDDRYMTSGWGKGLLWTTTWSRARR
jgi:hypothetical protein